MKALPAGEIDSFPFNGELRAVADRLGGLRDRTLDYAVDHPLEALFAVLATSSWLFYQAEREVNDDVRTYGDALHYISTCLSVGYARIYPSTPVGKLIASLVMAIGPSLSSWQLEGRLVARQARAEATTDPSVADLQAVVQRLDAILAELRTRSEVAGDSA